MPNMQKMPLWLPVPGWPYHITTKGVMQIRSNVRLDDRKRRVGGRVLMIQNGGSQITLRRTNEAGLTEVRCRGVVGLRAETIEAWLAAETEAEKATKRSKAKVKTKVKTKH